MIEFEVKSKTQPIGKRKGQTVYYAQPVSQQHLTNKMVVDRIVRETSLSAGDVSNALISLGAIVRDAPRIGTERGFGRPRFVPHRSASQDDGYRGRSYGRQPEGTENSLYAKSSHA